MPFPPNTSWKLTRVLVAAIDNVANTYLEAIEAGVLSKSDIHTAAMLSRSLHNLQIKVLRTHETTLRDSWSICRALHGFFKGRSFTILGCIHEKEHLSDPNCLTLRHATQVVSLRQRAGHISSLQF
ncbi:hypothetical protein C8R44DRAFT_879302 [Mycena epipterygia]|nr:hypothetical protein C8R44DRAFT_879302 [Mycena epipterygia]